MSFSVFLTIILAIIFIPRVIQENIGKSESEAIQINDMDALKKYGVPDGTIRNMRLQIYTILSTRFDFSKDDTAIVDIRLETINHSTSYGDKVLTFVADIEKFKQTYEIKVAWNNTVELADDTTVECTKRSDSKWPEEMCFGTYTTSESVELYVPYEGKTSSNEPFTISLGNYKESKQILVVSSNNCGKEEIKKNAELAARKYIDEVGLNVEDFVFETPSIYKECILK